MDSVQIRGESLTALPAAPRRTDPPWISSRAPLSPGQGELWGSQFALPGFPIAGGRNSRILVDSVARATEQLFLPGSYPGISLMGRFCVGLVKSDISEFEAWENVMFTNRFCKPDRRRSGLPQPCPTAKSTVQSPSAPSRVCLASFKPALKNTGQNDQKHATAFAVYSSGESPLKSLTFKDAELCQQGGNEGGILTKSGFS